MVELAANRGAGVPFRWRTRVYWEDTDAGGVVYHANYLKFCERARSEWLRAHGIDQLRLRETSGVLFVVRDQRIAYRRAARLDDELDTSVEVTRRRAASLEFLQRITRVGDDALIAESELRVACVAAAGFTPTAIPDHLLSGIKTP